MLASSRTRNEVVLDKKSSYKLIRNAMSAEASFAKTASKYPPRSFQEPPTAGPIVHDEAVATEDGLDVSQHLEVLAGACMP